MEVHENLGHCFQRFEKSENLWIHFGFGSLKPLIIRPWYRSVRFSRILTRPDSAYFPPFRFFKICNSSYPLGPKLATLSRDKRKISPFQPRLLNLGGGRGEAKFPLMQSNRPHGQPTSVRRERGKRFTGAKVSSKKLGIYPDTLLTSCKLSQF